MIWQAEQIEKSYRHKVLSGLSLAVGSAAVDIDRGAALDRGPGVRAAADRVDAGVLDATPRARVATRGLRKVRRERREEDERVALDVVEPHTEHFT